MKVLFVIKGGPVIDGQLLNPGRIIEEGSRVYNMALNRIKKGIEPKWSPLARFVHCDIADLEDALAEMPDELRNAVCKGVAIKRALPEVLRQEVALEAPVEVVEPIVEKEVVDVKVQALVSPEPIPKAMKVDDKTKGRKTKEA